MSNTDAEDIAVQEPLPTLGLPDYHGRQPNGVKTRLNGAGNRINRAHEIDSTVVLVVEAKVKTAGHAITARDGLLYVETFQVADLFEMEGKAGRRLLSGLRQAYRLGDDQANGRKVLPGLGDPGPFLGPKGWTDASGRVLDETELAEIRGETLLRGINSPELDPVVIVFDDGRRRVWPDEFDDEGVVGTRPSAGDFVGDHQVREVLDGDGEFLLEEWTDEQEDARLAELEDAAAKEEATQDREAYAELQAARGVRVSPWPEYEEMSATQVKGVVSELSERAELLAVLEYEEAGKGRKTIVEAVSRRLGEVG